MLNSFIIATSFKDWNVTVELLLFLIPLIFFSGTFYSLVQELKKDLESVANEMRIFHSRHSARISALERKLPRLRRTSYEDGDESSSPSEDGSEDIS